MSDCGCLLKVPHSHGNIAANPDADKQTIARLLRQLGEAESKLDCALKGLRFAREMIRLRHMHPPVDKEITILTIDRALVGFSGDEEHSPDTSELNEKSVLIKAAFAAVREMEALAKLKIHTLGSACNLVFNAVVKSGSIQITQEEVFGHEWSHIDDSHQCLRCGAVSGSLTDDDLKKCRPVKQLLKDSK